VGGEDAELNEFPWLAALVVPRTRQPFCGAALINDRFVLTAAHCFFFVNGQPSNVEVVLRAQLMDFKLNSLAVALGALKAKSLAWGAPGSIRGRGFNFSRKSDTDEKSLRYKVVKITNHPLFNNKFDFDVSLLQLETPIDFRMPDAPVPICLPPVNATDEMYHDDRALVSGWGKGLENAGSNNRLLQKLDVPILNLKVCNETMPYDLTSRMICAGFFDGGKDACTGDSGGPLIYRKPQGFIEQIGIVSWGEGCARIARPGLYSRVSEFIQWIEYETSLAKAKWCSGSYY
jgi:transmembrane serine protease 9